MFAVQNLTRVAAQTCRTVGQRRTIISGPPSVRIPFPEKLVHAAIMAVGFLGTPLWVLTNMKHYKKGPE